MKRGDIVLSVASGDFGKPRPALVVQSDGLNPTHDSILLCPFTTDLQRSIHYRVLIEPTADTGLRQRSQLMVDKIVALRRSRIREVIGRLDDAQMQVVNEKMIVVLGLA